MVKVVEVKCSKISPQRDGIPLGMDRWRSQNPLFSPLMGNGRNFCVSLENREHPFTSSILVCSKHSFSDLESTSASEQSAVRLAGDFLLILFS